VALRMELERMARESQATSLAHSMMAQLDLVEGRWQDAIGELNESHRLNLEIPRYHERLGIAELRLGRTADAAEALAKAVRIEPSARAWRLLAEARAGIGDDDGARRAQREAESLEREPRRGERP
jgi:tetratricopeptide (TPR) repeat protein